MTQPYEIGFVTDEVSRDLREAFAACREWGISRFELREGSERRTPDLSKNEISLIEEEIGNGAVITALSPGVFKQPVENRDTIEEDLESRLPATLELANRFNCSTVIVFGFEKHKDSSAARHDAQKILARAAELAADAGVVLAIENEPAFWVDKPDAAVELLREIDHPHLQLNWDAANLHWGGTEPTPEHLQIVAPYLRNLHVKDFTPDDPRVPWRPLGEGITPWKSLLTALRDLEEDGVVHLDQLTIETHWEPLMEGSRRSLDQLRRLLDSESVARSD